MANTLTPFLYNTKTLSRLARAGSTTLRSSSIHTTPARRRDFESNRDPSIRDIPFELPPDLQVSIEQDAEARDSLTPTEREIFGNIFTEIARSGRKPKILTTHPSKPTALPAATPQKPPAEQKPMFLAGLIDGPMGFQRDEPDAPPPKLMEPLDAASITNAIMESAALEHSRKTPGLIPGLDPSAPLQATNAADEREKALMSFPPTLRRAARQAFGMFHPVQPTVTMEGGAQAPLGTQPEGTRLKNTDQAKAKAKGSGRTKEAAQKILEADAQRRKARMLIRERMEACGNDFEVWEVMEEKVFTLVQQLGIEDSTHVPTPTQAPVKGKRGRRKKNVPAAEADAARVAALAVSLTTQTSPKAELDVEIYGPMYPQLLLDGLNILGTKFSRPSPHMMHILPRIKELGLVSYVMGVSTAFYNRLILILWERFGDAAGVLQLLEEMQQAGVYFDKDSLSVVSRIQTAFDQANNGQRGKFVQMMMRTPEYEAMLAMRFNHWVGSILANMRERETYTHEGPVPVSMPTPRSEKHSAF